MAQSTVTRTYLRTERSGRDRILIYDFNITAAKADGAEVTASDFGLKQIREVEVLGQENGGYVIQYVPDAQGGEYVGDGDLRAYEAGADGAVLDEVVGDEDVGQVRVKIVGY